jgi:uncharacterized protein
VVRRRDQLQGAVKLYRYRKLAFGALGALGLVGGAVAYASLIEPRTILVREIDLAIPTLPQSLSGTKLAFLSDFHLGGPGDPRGSAERALNVLREHQPDFILLGGDYYDRGIRVVQEPDWTQFREIAPTFAVMGNHDYHRGQRTTGEIIEKLNDSGIVLLRNGACDVELGAGKFRIIGLDDPYSGRADFNTAIKHLNGDIHPKIMIVHAGLIADELPVASADLIVSGHTHGTQIRISPFRHTGPLDVFWWLDYIKRSPLSRFRQGLFRVRGTLLYVGNGLGTTSLGMRFLAAPEVAIFRLFSGMGNADHSCDSPDHYILRNETRWFKPQTAAL